MGDLSAVVILTTAPPSESRGPREDQAWHARTDNRAGDADNTFRREKLVAAAWLVVFAVLAGGSIYNKMGRPALEATTTAAADVAPRAR